MRDNIFSVILKALQANKENQLDLTYLDSEDQNKTLFELKKHGVCIQVFDNENVIIPEEMKSKLREFKHEQSLFSLKALKYLKILQNDLELNEIPFIVLKGPSLSLKAYGNINNRTFNDLDLLISTQHIKVAVEIVRKRLPDFFCQLDNFTSAQINYTYKNFVDISFLCKKTRFPIEMHQNLFTRKWDQIKQPIKFEKLVISGISFSTLESKHFIVHQFYHASKHYWNKLKFLHDIHQYLKVNSFLEKDWEAVYKIAKQERVQNCVHQGVVLLNKYYNFEIPRCYSPKKISPYLISFAIHSLQHQTNKHPSFFAEARYNWLLHQSISKKLSFLRKFTKLSPNDFYLLKLPNQLFFLYYILRPFLQLYRNIFSKQYYTNKINSIGRNNV